jgi:hypothetical protein
LSWIACLRVTGVGTCVCNGIRAGIENSCIRTGI